MSFFDDIDDAPKCKAVKLPAKSGRNGSFVTVYAHAVTAQEMTQIRIESAAAVRGLPDELADKLFRARVIQLCILAGEDPNSQPVFAKTELNRITGLPYAI